MTPDEIEAIRARADNVERLRTTWMEAIGDPYSSQPFSSWALEHVGALLNSCKDIRSLLAELAATQAERDAEREKRIAAEVERDWAHQAKAVSVARAETAERRAKVADAEVERLRVRWWRHTDICSMLCTDACNEQHTYEPGCQCYISPEAAVAAREEPTNAE